MKRSSIILIVVGLVVAVALLAVVALSGTSKADQRAVAAANNLYDAGHYAEAAQIYEQLVGQGARDSVLFYNLGNTYFQQGDLARAIPAYELAAQLAPRDPDIRHNLEVARRQAQFAPAQPDGPLAILAEASRHWLTINELALLALAAWFLFCLLVMAYRHYLPGQRPALLRLAAGVALLFVLIAGVTLFSRMAALPSLPNVNVAPQTASATSMAATVR